MSDATVVLLHGLARTGRSMRVLKRELQAQGFRTWTCTYPSRSASVVELSELVSSWIERDLGDAQLCAVTHSLGGILLRHMAHAHRWHRSVLVAPPNAGSRVAALLSSHRLYRRIYGPAGQDLAAGQRWPLPPRAFAVIAGTRAFTWSNPVSWLTRALEVFPPGVDSDGTVAVSETKLASMADFACVPAGHTRIIQAPRTAELVVRFLEKGRFGGEAGGV
ncbi:MAG: hypothetical protein V3V08_04630 [Nannocystaceae bacterium]